MKLNRRGQVTAEMAVLFTFVIAAFVFMGIYLQRAAQGGVKGNADGLGQQFSTQGDIQSHSHQHAVTAVGSTTTDSDGTYTHHVN